MGISNIPGVCPGAEKADPSGAIVADEDGRRHRSVLADSFGNDDRFTGIEPQEMLFVDDREIGDSSTHRRFAST